MGVTIDEPVFPDERRAVIGIASMMLDSSARNASFRSRVRRTGHQESASAPNCPDLLSGVLGRIDAQVATDLANEFIADFRMSRNG
jgi:hypothetical protein